MKLYDQFGAQVKRGDRLVLEEVVVQGVRDRFPTYPSAGLTPERLAQILREADEGHVGRQAELFEEFEEKSPRLQSDLQIRKLAVAGLSWEVQPASPSAEDRKIAAAAREMLDYVEDFEGALFDGLDAIAKGFAVQEIFWEVAARQVWVKRLKWVHQKRFTFYSEGAVLEFPRLLTDAQPVLGESLPPFKFVYHRHRARSGAAPRGGLARPIAYLYLFSNYALKDWVIFNELYSVPMRLGKYKAGATAAEIDILKQAVFGLATDAAAVLSDSMVIELLETKNRAGDVPSFKEFLQWSDRTISKVVLGHTGLAEPTPGRLGSEKVARQLRQDLLQHDARSLQNTLRSQLLWPWVVYQFGPEKACPKFCLNYKAEEDLEQLAKVYASLVKQIGFDEIALDHIYDRFGIPRPRPGERTLLDLRREKADELANQTAPQLQTQTEAALKPFFELIQNGASYAEVMSRLAVLSPNLDPAQIETFLRGLEDLDQTTAFRSPKKGG